MSETQAQNQPVEEKPAANEVPKGGEESDSDDHDHDHHGHDHDHDHHGHDHDHDHGHDGKDGEGRDKKSSRGEKKFKKSMTKLGMKPITGITRVTIRKAKSLLLYIDDPEVLKSPGSDNAYIIFGEAKIHDLPGSLGTREIEKLNKERPVEEVQANANANANVSAPVENKQPESQAQAQDLDEAGLKPEDIETVMSHCTVSRTVAVKALRSYPNDSVSAILNIDNFK
jgi:nascent polypeptide-associated complex subunit alpha